MQISKSVSEKITFKDTATDRFQGREFMASRSVSLPDNAPLELVQLRERELDYDLRKQVLTNFVLEGVITPEAMKQTLAPYKQLLDAATAAWEAAQA